MGIAWQIVFLIIASDPLRFRPLMLAALVEKFPFVISSVLLIVNGRTAITFAVPVAIDFILGLLFLTAFIKTESNPPRRQPDHLPAIFAFTSFTGPWMIRSRAPGSLSSG